MTKLYIRTHYYEYDEKTADYVEKGTIQKQHIPDELRDRLEPVKKIPIEDVSGLEVILKKIRKEDLDEQVSRRIIEGFTEIQGLYDNAWEKAYYNFGDGGIFELSMVGDTTSEKVNKVIDALNLDIQKTPAGIIRANEELQALGAGPSKTQFTRLYFGSKRPLFKYGQGVHGKTLDFLLNHFDDQHNIPIITDHKLDHEKNYLVYNPYIDELRVVLALRDTPFSPNPKNKKISVKVNDLVEFQNIFRYGKKHTGFGLNIEFDSFKPEISQYDEKIYEIKEGTDLDTWLGINIGHDAAFGRRVRNEMIRLGEKGNTSFVPFIPSMIGFEHQKKKFGEKLIDVDFTMLEYVWGLKAPVTDLRHSPLTRMMDKLEVLLTPKINDIGLENVHGFLGIGERGREYGSVLEDRFGIFAYRSSRAAGSSQIHEVDDIFTSSEYSADKMHEFGKKFWHGFEKGQTVFITDDLKATGGSSQAMARYVLRHGGNPVLITGIKLGYQPSSSMKYVINDKNEVYFITEHDDGFSYVEIEDHNTGKPKMVINEKGEKVPSIKKVKALTGIGKIEKRGIVEEISPYLVEKMEQDVKHKVIYDNSIREAYRPIAK